MIVTLADPGGDRNFGNDAHCDRRRQLGGRAQVEEGFDLGLHMPRDRACTLGALGLDTPGATQSVSTS
jgi:hypothetical protein